MLNAKKTLANDRLACPRTLVSFISFGTSFCIQARPAKPACNIVSDDPLSALVIAP